MNWMGSAMSGFLNLGLCPGEEVGVRLLVLKTSNNSTEESCERTGLRDDKREEEEGEGEGGRVRA